MAVEFRAPLSLQGGPVTSLTWRSATVARAALTVLVAVGVSAVYLAGAFTHAQRMNIIKRQGDQSSYVQYAKDIYGNWTGRQPTVAGDRNRMPLYPAYQALFYTPDLSDEAFFQRGKVTSIALSLALLGIVFLVSSGLPMVARVSLTTVAAFTCFVFKAGYFQAELLYYTLHFTTFVAACRLLTRDRRGACWRWAGITGLAAALAYLTKAATLPLVALVGAALVIGAPPGGAGRPRWRVRVERAVAAALLAATFLLVLSPYLLTSKRLFGHYFYNVNSTFYMWYDEWGDAIKGTRAHGDREGWPRMPRALLPGPAKYWREHSLADIGARIAGGFRQMAMDLWAGFWVLKFAVTTLLASAYVLWPHRQRIPALLRAHTTLAGFVVAQFVVYLTLAAFYAPISGTGVARFTLGQYLPLLFVAAALRWHPAFQPPAHVAPAPRAMRAEWFLLATLALDVPFSIWPRLLTTYAGF